MTIATKKTNSITLFFRASFGLLLFPLDALWGLAKGTFYFLKSPTNYFWSNKNDTTERSKREDHKGRMLSATMGLSRFLTITAFTLCTLGFVGSLLIPLPGVAPLYAATALGILKAAGIITAWSITARLVGSIIGSFIDYFKIKNVISPNPNPETTTLTANKSSTKSTARLFKGLGITAVTVGFFGEAGSAMTRTINPTAYLDSNTAYENDILAASTTSEKSTVDDDMYAGTEQFLTRPPIDTSAEDALDSARNSDDYNHFTGGNDDDFVSDKDKDKDSTSSGSGSHDSTPVESDGEHDELHPSKKSKKLERRYSYSYNADSDPIHPDSHEGIETNDTASSLATGGVPPVIRSLKF